MTWPFWLATSVAWLISLIGGLIAIFADPGALTMCIGAGIAAFIMSIFSAFFTIAERKGWDL